MPHPPPLAGVVSARRSPADYSQLTPRTPHLRPGRAEEGYTEIELVQVTDYDHDHEEPDEQQTTALLSSFANDNSPPSRDRNRVDESGIGTRITRGKDKSVLGTVLSRLPLIAGVLLAGLLLALAILSFRSPVALPRFFGVSVTNKMPSNPLKSEPPTPPPPHNVLSYENYTTFPLLPSEYRSECYKLHTGYMSHGDYWEADRTGVLDVVHQNGKHDHQLPEGQPTAVCTSTITYMLDGEVGLLADLALMAQAAALAREVGGTFNYVGTYLNEQIAK